jgi:hypothetical protein
VQSRTRPVRDPYAPRRLKTSSFPSTELSYTLFEYRVKPKPKPEPKPVVKPGSRPVPSYDKPPPRPSSGSYFADDSPPEPAGTAPNGQPAYFETDLQQHFDPIDKRPYTQFGYKLPPDAPLKYPGDEAQKNPQQGAKDEL